MNKAEKIKFINQLIRNVKKNIIKSVNKMPNNWNGFEIKAFISDSFNIDNKIDIKRYKDYENIKIIKGI